MPRGMNGRQLAEEALRLRPKLPVLFATGYTRKAIIHHGRLDPDVELLSKPFHSGSSRAQNPAVASRGFRLNVKRVAGGARRKIR